MVGFWFIYVLREIFFPTGRTPDVWEKIAYQISGSLLSFFILLEVTVFSANYFILRAIESEMQSLSIGGNETINTIPTIGS